MATGDITATFLGEVVTSGATLAILEALNLGAAKTSEDTKSVMAIPVGNQTFLYLLARSA